MDLKNNTILITGGSRGIGLEFAKQFLSLGNRVIIIGRDSNRLKQVKDQFPEILVLQLDLSDTDFIQKLKANPPPLFREVNILLNNAGIGRRINLKAPPMDLDLLEEVQVNLNAPIQLTNLLLPQLLEKKQAAIVNVTSALAFLPLAKVPIYSATKAGLHSFTLSLRKQLHKSTVRVFEIAPPTTDTEMLKGFDANDLNGIKPMTPKEVVQQSIKNMMHEKLETFPGASKKTISYESFSATFYIQSIKPELTIKGICMKNILGLLAIAFLSLNAYANIPRKMKCSEKPRNGYESARITFHAL